MNRGLYKASGYIAYYKTWENSLENSGVSISFKYPASPYEEYHWTNIEKINGSFLIGAACLAQW